MKSNYRMLIFAIMALTLIVVNATVRGGRTEKSDKGNKAEAAGQDTHGTNKSDIGTPKLSAILLVNSVSCPCTREQCAVAEKIVKKLKADYGDVVSFETIDYEPQIEKAKPLMDKYEAYMIPALLVLDKDKRLVWQCIDFSKEETIRSKIKQLVAGSVSR